jgi:hypothetical protein
MSRRRSSSRWLHRKRGLRANSCTKCDAASIAALRATLSQAVSAQEFDSLAAQRVGHALARLGGGELVRVHAGGNGRSEGAILSGSPALVRLRTGSNIKIVSVGRIDSLWVQTGSCGGPCAKKGPSSAGQYLAWASALLELWRRGPASALPAMRIRAAREKGPSLRAYCSAAPSELGSAPSSAARHRNGSCRCREKILVLRTKQEKRPDLS